MAAKWAGKFDVAESHSTSTGGYVQPLAVLVRQQLEI